MFTTTLKPGLLVSLKTSIRGGALYQRVDLEQDHITEDGTRRAAWNTTREIRDPEDYARAIVARGKARSLITAACCRSDFGLLCPTDNEWKLQDALVAAREVVAAHNKSATSTQVDVYVITGRVAQDDVEAVKAISAEVRDLMAAMEQGIESANPEAIRDAANRARSLGGMLSPEASKKVADAIQQARSAAREIVRRVEKAGETAADVVAELDVDKIRAGRFAFLDIDAPQVQEFEQIEVAGRAVDLGPTHDDGDGEAAYAATMRAIELGD